ncbi:hypothetical protein ACIRU8_10225 [Streptomyces sp. NPDC101175]|uniref:hypothetical protein n=1 Tax=Streptomyces sp. NPDC101175 TaxID=3366123 RepID=UPI003833798A
MRIIPQTSMATSEPIATATLTGGVQVPTVQMPEKSITAFAVAEVITNADDGQLTLCTATDEHLADYRASTVGQTIAAAQKLREKADQIEALADEYADKIILPALIQKFRIHLEELDAASVFAELPDVAAEFGAFVESHADGSYTFAVPAGQKPSARLAVILTLLRWQGAREQ